MNLYQYVVLGFAVILGLCGVALAGIAVYRGQRWILVAAAGALLMFLATMSRLAEEL
jgi:hypothetical protein